MIKWLIGPDRGRPRPRLRPAGRRGQAPSALLRLTSGPTVSPRSGGLIWVPLHAVALCPLPGGRSMAGLSLLHERPDHDPVVPVRSDADRGRRRSRPAAASSSRGAANPLRTATVIPVAECGGQRSQLAIREQPAGCSPPPLSRGGRAVSLGQGRRTGRPVAEGAYFAAPGTGSRPCARPAAVTRWRDPRDGQA
jgi:hypothetical protein